MSVIGYSVVDDSLSPDFPLGDAVVPERGTRRAPVPTKTWLIPILPSSSP